MTVGVHLSLSFPPERLRLRMTALMCDGDSFLRRARTRCSSLAMAQPVMRLSCADAADISSRASAHSGSSQLLSSPAAVKASVTVIPTIDVTGPALGMQRLHTKA